MPLRILFLSSEHAATKGTGGVGSYIATITRALAELGHDVHVLSCLEGAEAHDRVEHGVTLHVRPLLRIRGLGRLVRGPKTQRALRRAASNYRHARRLGSFAVVEAPDWQAEGLVFTFLRRTPLVTHLHTPEHVLQHFNQEPVGRDSRVVCRLERTSARRSSRITCPAGLLVDHLRSEGWLGAERVDIIRYPVDWQRLTPDAAAGSSERTVLYVGRLEPRKAPELLVQALAILWQRGVEATAVFVGRSSGARSGLGYAEWVEAEAARLDVRCVFVGETLWSETPKLYSDARVVCVPSEFESFSMTAVEGMAAARPIVITDMVGAVEILGDQTSGQVSVATAAGLAESLSPFLTDDELATSTGQANRETVIHECDPRQVARERAGLYAELAAGHRTGVRRWLVPGRQASAGG